MREAAAVVKKLGKVARNVKLRWSCRARSGEGPGRARRLKIFKAPALRATRLPMSGHERRPVSPANAAPRPAPLRGPPGCWRSTHLAAMAAAAAVHGHFVDLAKSADAVCWHAIGNWKFYDELDEPLHQQAILGFASALGLFANFRPGHLLRTATSVRPASSRVVRPGHSRHPRLSRDICSAGTPPRCSPRRPPGAEESASTPCATANKRSAHRWSPFPGRAPARRRSPMSTRPTC